MMRFYLQIDTIMFPLLSMIQTQSRPFIGIIIVQE